MGGRRQVGRSHRPGCEGFDVTDELAAHLTPAQHDHINFYGTYSFDIDAELRRDGRRPLRIPA